jgi:hypothetical protein
VELVEPWVRERCARAARRGVALHNTVKRLQLSLISLPEVNMPAWLLLPGLHHGAATPILPTHTHTHSSHAHQPVAAPSACAATLRLPRA